MPNIFRKTEPEKPVFGAHLRRGPSTKDIQFTRGGEPGENRIYICISVGTLLFYTQADGEGMV